MFRSISQAKGRVLTAIENYKSPEEIMRFFEAEMLKDGLISEKMDRLILPDHQPKTRWIYWCVVQLVHFGFAVRAAILFLLPITCPECTGISLVLGDGLSFLGVAVREMWYSLSFTYSVLFSLLQIVLKRSEGRRQLHFVTDYAPAWAAKVVTDQPDGLKKLRLQLNLLFIGHKYFDYIICTTIVSSLSLAIFLETMAKKSPAHLLFNLIWAGYNCIWMVYATSTLFTLFVYTWLATRGCCRWLTDAHETGQRILRHHRANRVSMKISKMIVKLRVQFYTAAEEVDKYNRCIKHILQLFRTLFIPICATNTYVHFTSTYPNLMSRFLVISLTMNQLVVIYLFMSLSAVPYRNSLPIADVISSMLARMGNELSLRQKKQLLEIRNRITDSRYPVGYTCGDVFWFGPKSMMDFLFEIGSVAILCLQMIIKIG